MEACMEVVDLWIKELVDYLKDPLILVDFKLKQKAINYVLAYRVLYKRERKGLVLKCVRMVQFFKIMVEVHEGHCRSHGAGPIMKWLIYHHRYYWSTITVDCFQYATRWKACQLCRPIQRVPSELLHLVIKPWPFNGWAMDLIGKIYILLPKKNICVHHSDQWLLY